MATPVIMPKLEMTQETATVIAWIVQEGEQVGKGLRSMMPCIEEGKS